MLRQLQTLLRENRLAYRYLAYAHCKKNPRELGEVTALPWAGVEGPLARILTDQIAGLLDETRDEDCFVGRYAGAPVDIQSVCPPELPAEVRSRPLVGIMRGLVDGAPGQDPAAAHTEAMRLIAWKYLAQNRSQGAVLCLITFDAPLDGRVQRLAFLTQVDLEDLRTEALIGDDGRLKAEELKNVFERKSLSKGALYPWLPAPAAPAYDPDQIYVHNEKAVEYWKLTLECERPVLAAAAERNRIVAALKSAASAPARVPAIIRQMSQAAALHPTMAQDDVAQIAAAVDGHFSRERLGASWRSLFGSPGYAMNAQSAVGPTTRAFEVFAGDLRIPKVRPALLDQMVQVSHLGRRYLVIPLEGPARFRAEGADCDLPEITLDQLMDRLMNPR